MLMLLILHLFHLAIAISVLPLDYSAMHLGSPISIFQEPCCNLAVPPPSEQSIPELSLNVFRFKSRNHPLIFISVVLPVHVCVT